MARRKLTGRSRITEAQISEMIRLHRLGKSISAIAQATGCHRQTVRVYLRERRSDILADEVRKALLVDELRKHLDEVTRFASSLVETLAVPVSPFEERDATAVLNSLFRRYIPVERGSEPQEAKKKHQDERRKRILFDCLQAHTGKEQWQVFEEWKQSWDSCKVALEQLREEANEVLSDLLKRKPGLKEAVEKETGKRDAVERIVHDVLWVVWQAGTVDRLAGEYDFSIKEGQLVAHTGGDEFYPLRLKLGETPQAQHMVEVCKLAFEALYRSFNSKRIAEMLDTMERKIEAIEGFMDPLILRSAILRTRCDLCPA